jgi:hypothetical protein
MATEAYIPQDVQLAGEPISETFALTLHDPDSDTPHGTLTTHQPPAEGTRRGPLVVRGTRDGQAWRVTLPEIEVYRASSVGCEFNVYGRIERVKLKASADAS